MDKQLTAVMALNTALKITDPCSCGMPATWYGWNIKCDACYACMQKAPYMEEMHQSSRAPLVRKLVRIYKENVQL